MYRARSSWIQSISCKTYAWLLQLYPKSYRQRYAADMLSTFGDCCRFKLQERGSLGLLGLWLPTLFDLSLTILDKHFEEGVLSTRLATIRVASIAVMLASGAVFIVGWDAENYYLLLATLVFTGGALSLLVTLPGTRRIIRGRLSMSNLAIQSSIGPRPLQVRSTRWAMTALLGLCIFDFIDLALDATSGASYVQPIVTRYGWFAAFLVGAVPRLMVYLAGLWLFRKQSAWVVLPALLVAIPRAIFSDGAIRAILNSQVPNTVDGGAILFALAVFLTSLWFVIELRQTKPAKQSELDNAN